MPNERNNNPSTSNPADDRNRASQGSQMGDASRRNQQTQANPSGQQQAGQNQPRQGQQAGGSKPGQQSQDHTARPQQGSEKLSGDKLSSATQQGSRQQRGRDDDNRG